MESDEEDGEFEVEGVVQIIIIDDDGGGEHDPDGDDDGGGQLGFWPWGGRADGGGQWAGGGEVALDLF